MSLRLYDATVKSFGVSLGLGTEKSSVKVNLVEAEIDGDLFVPPPIGTPTRVTFGSLDFHGVLQRWTRSGGSDGLYTYQVDIDDPRDILDNAKVILASYSGSVFGVPNLLNVYGYCENAFGFGGSQINEAGMPWSLVKAGIHALTTTSGSFGAPLRYKDNNTAYAVDLSQLPDLPSYYRIGGGGAQSILQLVSQVCADSGCDYFVELRPGTSIIRVRVIRRRLQPPIGGITSQITAATAAGNFISSNVGLEAVNETTSVFIVGGEVCSMLEADSSTIKPYFGEHPINGTPLVGTGTGADMITYLNAREVATFIGSNLYLCTGQELMAALSGVDVWKNYITVYKPTMASLLTLTSQNVQAAANGVLNPQVPFDFKNFKRQNAVNLGAAQVASNSDFVVQQVFIMVQKAAQEYFGKQFFVEIPFLSTKTEPETGLVVYSQDPTDGGYVESGIPPLGLPPQYGIKFQLQDGRFEAFARYTLTGLEDFSRVSPADYLIDTFTGLTAWVKVSVDKQIVFANAITPGVIVTIQNPLYQRAADNFGAGATQAIALLQGTPEGIARANQGLVGGTIQARVATPPDLPSYIAIPLKSNITCYGPWYAVGALGRVDFQFDQSMVPWQYAGTTLLNLTAQARVVDAITFQQVSESADWQEVGLPTFNIGDVVSSGPNITRIDINYGEQGVTSSYQTKTFTPKFGILSKANADRFKRIGNLVNKTNGEIQNAFNRIYEQPVTRGSGGFGSAASSLGGLPSDARLQSPSLYVAALNQAEIDYNTREETQITRTVASLLTEAEGLRSLIANRDEVYQKIGMVSLDAIFKPFSNDNDSVSAQYMAAYEDVNENYTKSLSVFELDPYKQGNDINVYTRGSTYPSSTGGIYAYPQGGPEDDVRGVAMRIPVLTGWCYTVDDVWEPNEFDEQTADYQRKSQQWPVGPLEILFDKERGVFTPYGMLMGVTQGVATRRGGSTTIDLYEDASTVLEGRQRDRTVYNFFSQDIPANSRIMAMWIPEARSWWIVAQDCP